MGSYCTIGQLYASDIVRNGKSYIRGRIRPPVFVEGVD
jgi:hypothetical protein